MDAASNSTAVPAPGPAATVPKLDNVFGALLLGTFVSLICYGVTVNQAYRYFRLYRSDSTFYRCTVICVLILETFQSLSIIHCCYYYLVSNYFNPTALLRGSWSLQVQSVCDGAVIVVTQLFFAHRVYIVSVKYRAVVVAAIFFSFVALGFGGAASIMAVRVSEFSHWSRYTWLDAAAFGGAMVSDSLTTTALIVILRKSRTGFRGTDDIVDRLVLYTVNTGLLTGVANTVAMICAVTMRDNMIYAAFATLATKLYANSLLAVLNARHSLASGNRGLHNVGLNGLRNQTDVSASDTTHVPHPSERTAVNESTFELKSRSELHFA
ncbi:hypothetical protein OH77DRAFT_1426983 [Trametes cingulata]|nr:hypothetical protein OH77DRAFT_1426983 [Trametes cingulata]